MQNSFDQSIISSRLVNLYSQLALLEQQNDNTSISDSKHLKSVLDSYQNNYLYLKSRYKTEQERIDRRFDFETSCTRAYFAAKKAELKEHLLDRLRRKRKLVIDEIRSDIDIHSPTFNVDSLFITMQTSHPLQTKAYNFRQRPDIGQQTSMINEEEFFSTNGILPSMLQQQPTRKRFVGAFSIFQLPKWTIKDEECEDDIKMISNSRK
ncbi:unnamed protein product [Rotaria sp. Silwood1]|nr:unnamed protein product [Rotaria sp. Silwood1]CAF3426789.1 unnamed protein product [Rotaria sp. Silwood1]CAF3427156.1 unnamed protein product [Rotaria sp. Silwood1]CAF4887920.1 unnamed protein product [Rotaria sp. Silwood1]CAF4955015.1 unnamed protein product [Rotaria sp. Silwood1]